MHWWFLSGAIVAEVLATLSLRASTDADPAWPWWVFTGVGYASAFGLLFAALSHGAALSGAYATWSGVGVALTAIAAWLVFGERLTIGAIVGIVLVIAGVVLIEWSSSAATTEAPA
ncbi:small multidrug resistance pump [Microbacterium resistens]|uniref:Small multidrug resistance pump n=1 Tax=Microbacterium resistens TaxID=156977 RepID=A0ABU1SBZ9_9MICO|nr:SMR family transporter [Microbacterium resistens]MDR6866422.1 small multidrug resistance pump [Microbacterium resistens]